MKFCNLTDLDSARLMEMIRGAVGDWPLNGLDVTVRYSRSSDFSGTCFYKTGRIYVNIGRHVGYPYPLKTYLARARSSRGRWWREIYSIVVEDAYQLVLFVFMHELYHWLVRLARRNTRQKEARCDRFAARALVDHYGLSVLDSQAMPVARNEWDFQDLDGFVAPGLRTRVTPMRLRTGTGLQPCGLTKLHPVAAARPAIRRHQESSNVSALPVQASVGAQQQPSSPQKLRVPKRSAKSTVTARKPRTRQSSSPRTTADQPEGAPAISEQLMLF